MLATSSAYLVLLLGVVVVEAFLVEADVLVLLFGEGALVHVLSFLFVVFLSFFDKHISMQDTLVFRLNRGNKILNNLFLSQKFVCFDLRFDDFQSCLI